MAWCPKCRTEYREGFTICADCGSTLVEELPAESEQQERKPKWDEAAENREMMRRMEEEEQRRKEKAEKKEKKEKSKSSISKPAAFQDSSERASDNRSSGWTLLILGGAGIIAVILGITGVLPLKLGNPYMFYGVMGAIFILFFVAGLMSFKNAKIFDKKAESENTLRSTLMDWCKENLTAEMIDRAVSAPGDTEEVLYFKRFLWIRERLNHQFVNLDQAFLERFIDDYVYESVFEDEA